jgi:hypothetical protein
MRAVPRSRVLSFVDAALDTAADPSAPVSAVVGRALRAARADGDAEALVAFTLESLGMKDNSWRDAVAEELRPHFASREDLAAAWSRAVERWMKLRTEEVDGKDMFFATSVGEIEAKMVDVSEVLKRPGLDQRAEAAALLSLARERQLLARIRQMAVDHLTRIERRALVGGMVETVFGRYRQRVDGFLSEYAPDVLEQLASAYRRRDENDDEALSHALTSCRRALKTLADCLYPARNEPVMEADGVQRKLTDDKFINRLMQYVNETRRSTTWSALATASLTDLGMRLEALNSLASKGVHATVDGDEVDQCIIQTYLVIGDILRMRAGADAR